VSDKSQLGEASNSSSNHGGLIGGLIIAILLIVMVIGALMYYRRRINHLKSELAHVQYIADPSSAPDRHHFDNPVYSFGNGGAANGGAVGGLNNASAIRIRNDLGGKCSINNLEKAKLGLASADNDDISEGAYGGSVSSTAELYKNKEADQGNPNLHNFNIYHTIDEEKVSKSMEHLYDEIKHKNKDYAVDEAYDRLDDSRPLTEVRPQYLRIASGSLGSLGGLGASGICPAPPALPSTAFRQPSTPTPPSPPSAPSPLSSSIDKDSTTSLETLDSAKV